ncbi:MAG: dihydrofolate reductase [Bacteroidales bacterium]|nr:dihydrofolate reductase [Bacteroidales bacterium]
MNKSIYIIMLTLSSIMFSCGSITQTEDNSTDAPLDTFKYQTEQFADVRILRYNVPDFEKLDIKRKLLVYYLYEAALSGRDIIWDQNYKHNLIIRKTIERIIEFYQGDRETDEFKKFIEYAKCMFVANGIHHHYSTDKFIPEFSEEFFVELINNSPGASFPCSEGESLSDFTRSIIPIIFNPELDSKRIVLDDNKDIIASSATNFYENITQRMVEEYYRRLIDPNDTCPVSYGLNSKMTTENGRAIEKVWKIGGMYGQAIEKIVFWLRKASEVSENRAQKAALLKLVDFYTTGNLRTFDDYSILWLKDTASIVDVVNGFIEVYGDPIGKRGAFQSMVSVRDIEASKRTRLIADNAQWFEDNLPYDEAYKKTEAKGINAKAIHVVAISGDNSPTPPIGVNLPNADWIRAEHGSKSVTISNLVNAYNESSKTSGALEEFAYSQQEIDWAKEYGSISSNLHTDLHEIIGHGSGKLKEGVGDPSATLKNYASALEEARAELVGLYFLTDPKLVELGLMSNLNVGKSQYNSYIRNGMLTQLVRIKLGSNVEQAHMRARKLIAEWAFEKGKPENVIEKKVKDGKTYFVINDHDKLRTIFGQMLREVQRIKSEGDFEAGKLLIETYAIRIDPELHREVLERWEGLNIAPYAAFINPVLVPVYDGDNIIDVRIEYPTDFLEQMMYYGKNYSFLPLYN